MKTYIKNYRYRVPEIVLTVLLSFLAVMLSSLLFKNKLNELSNQLERYQSSEYSSAYILNYGISANNEWIYADTDIQLFLKEDGTERLAVSCLMPQDEVQYSLEEQKEVSKVKTGEVILSRNVAAKYNLVVGDAVYVQYPYTTRLFQMRVSAISGTEYDFENPSISNDIGIVYIGFDEEYVNSTNCKYLLFAKESMVDVLSQYPQIISGIVNKSQNQSKVFSQGIYIFAFELFFLIAALMASIYFFFSRSFIPLRRLFLKGTSRSTLVKIPLTERLIWWFIPCGIGVLISSFFIPCNSNLTRGYYIIPLAISIIFIVLAWIHDLIKAH